MYVVAKHQISDPAKFWATANAAADKIPAGTRLHYVLPSTDGSSAVCLWEGSSVGAVRELVESVVGDVSQNEYFEVDAKNAMGLPA
jgi:hypothetical protein